MKHILSTIIIFFILLTSSVSWSEEVGYGDLRIGSDRSVVDKHCVEDDNVFECFGLDVWIRIGFDENNKVNVILIGPFDRSLSTFGSEEFDGIETFEEYMKIEKSLYYQITKRISKQYDLDGIWEFKSVYYTFFNEGTIIISVENNGGGNFSGFDVQYTDKKNGKELINKFNSDPKIRKFIPFEEFLNRF